MHALYLNWSILNFLEHEGVSMPHSGVCVYFHVSLKLELFSTNQFPGFIPLNNVWTYAEVPFLPQGEGELQQGSLPPPHEAVLFCLLQSEVAFCCVSLSEVNRSQLATTGKNEKEYSWHVPATKFIGVK